MQQHSMRLFYILQPVHLSLKLHTCKRPHNLHKHNCCQVKIFFPSVSLENSYVCRWTTMHFFVYFLAKFSPPLKYSREMVELRLSDINQHLSYKLNMCTHARIQMHTCNRKYTHTHLHSGKNCTIIMPKVKRRLIF